MLELWGPSGIICWKPCWVRAYCIGGEKQNWVGTECEAVLLLPWTWGDRDPPCSSTMWWQWDSDLTAVKHNTKIEMLLSQSRRAESLHEQCFESASCGACSVENTGFGEKAQWRVLQSACGILVCVCLTKAKPKSLDCCGEEGSYSRAVPQVPCRVTAANCVILLHEWFSL